MKRRKRDLDEAVPRPPAELIDELAIHIADGRNVLFITGAGLSVSAGIPAFRSGAGAVWEENVVQYGTRKSLRKDPVEWHNAFWFPTVFCSSKVSAAVSLHPNASSPGETVKGGFFSDFELVRAGSRPSKRKECATPNPPRPTTL